MSWLKSLIKPIVDDYIKDVFKEKLSGIETKVKDTEVDINQRLRKIETKLAVLENTVSFHKDDLRDIKDEIRNIFLTTNKMAAGMDYISLYVGDELKRKLNDGNNK